MQFAKKFSPSLLPLALIAGLLITTACESGPKQTARTISPADDPAKYIPSDVAMLMYADLQSIMKLPSMAKAIDEGIKSDEEARRMLESLGLDLKQDVKAVALGLRNTGGDERPIVALSAALDLDKLAEVAQQEAEDDLTIEAFEEGGLSGYTITQQYEDPMYVTKDGNFVLLGGSISDLSDAIATSKSGQSAMKTGNISEDLSMVNTGAHVWFVADGAALSQGSPQAQGLRRLGGSMDFSSGLAFTMSIEFADPNQAEQMAQQTQAMTQMMGGMMASEMPAVMPVVQNLKVSSAGSTMEVSLSLSQSQLDALSEAMQEMQDQGGGF